MTRPSRAEIYLGLGAHRPGDQAEIHITKEDHIMPTLHGWLIEAIVEAHTREQPR